MNQMVALLKRSAKKGGTSVEALTKRLETRRSTIYNYLEELKIRGIAVEQRRDGKTVYYSIGSSDAEETAIPEPIDGRAIRRYRVTRILENNGPMNTKEIRKQYGALFSEVLYTDDAEQRTIRNDELSDTLSDMVERGDVIKKKSAASGTGGSLSGSDVYELSPRNIPVILELNEEQMWNLYYQMESLGSGMPSEEQWAGIHEKVAILLDTEVSPVHGEDSFLVVGRTYTHFRRVQEQMQVIDRLPFQRRIIRVETVDKNGNTRWQELEIGAVVYSVEKDELYILASGKIKPRSGRGNLRKNANVILNMEKITDAQLTGKTNSWFGKEECRLLLETAFSVSGEEPVRVEVRFNDTRRIRKLLENLMKHRPHAVLRVENGTLLFTDGVSGMSDFAAYLRQYGGDFEVIAPESLREVIRLSAERTLARYKECGL
ncbi:MAG: WYL domain-containing protein [Lachnospiraceae bacterium]|nr:WYL domain-containing protein [Lachnospiraceae bacterium]